MQALSYLVLLCKRISTSNRTSDLTLIATPTDQQRDTETDTVTSSRSNLIFVAPDRLAEQTRAEHPHVYSRANMNPHHRYDDPLERAQAEAGDKQKDAMLSAFAAQIVGLAAVLEPEEERRRMGRLIETWIPALEDVGVVSLLRHARAGTRDGGSE